LKTDSISGCASRKNSGEIDELKVVAHQSFAFQTRSNGPFRIRLTLFRTRAALQLVPPFKWRSSPCIIRSTSSSARVKRPNLTAADRFLWAWLSSVWYGWESRVSIIKVATVIGWQPKAFGLFWNWKTRGGKPARPAVPKDVRNLIRTLSRENSLRRAPHIHGELMKLRINVGGTSVSKCLDHLIVFNERSLYWYLRTLVDYYHRTRVHLLLEKDTPEPRPIQTPASGRIVSIPVPGGLHHRYERRVA